MEDNYGEAGTINEIKKWLGAGAINIFGAPFSGKDTQGGKLAKALNAALIGGGDILRNNPVDVSVKQAIDAGKLAPIDKFLQIVLPYLSRPEFANKPLILSSVGRWHGEELGVLQAAAQSNHELKTALFIKVSENTIRERRQVQDPSAGHNRGTRQDDDAKALEVRLEEFKNKTLPVIEFYRNKNLLIEIDGEPDADKVFADIILRLHELAALQTG